ncbi:MAG: sugar translocase [Bacillota bacterium]
MPDGQNIQSSRTINSLKNGIMGIISQVLLIGMNFGTRTVFIIFLNQNLLGVNGLFTSVLTVLSLAELGFGTAVVFNLYKPLVQNDEKRIAALMHFYAKVYRAIGVLLGVLGLMLIPFLNILVKNEYIPDLVIIYLLFLSNTVVSYFFAYNRSIITADQKSYILSQYRLYFSVVKAAFQIGVLVLTRNFILFLIIMNVMTVLENFFVYLRVNKLYPYVRSVENKLERLEKSEVKRIWIDVRALMIYKLGSTILDGSGNIIISTFLGTALVGILSNYALIFGSLTTVLFQFTSAITASVGNFIASEDEERQEFLLRTITFANFVLFGSFFLFLYVLVNPFIEIWIGAKFMLDPYVVFVFALNWFIYGMMNSVWSFRIAMGLFVHGKFRPVASAIINIVVSLLLVNQFGIIGVLFGTLVARLATNVWYDPLIVFKHGLKKSVKSYYFVWSKYFLIIIAEVLFASFITSFITAPTILSLILKALICLVLAIGTMLVFRNTEEFKYLVKMVKLIINKQIR